ncbi:MAG: antibiotic biosynthesis monooxygenase family protein [Thermomicrobiales bacterium]
MIVLVASYFGTAGSGDAIEAQLRDMSVEVKATEPGCAMYQACRSVDNRDFFLLYEHYVDQSALEAHRETPHFKRIIEGIVVPMLEKRERALYDLAVS